jgi:peptidylprolyl isomerase
LVTAKLLEEYRMRLTISLLAIALLILGLGCGEGTKEKPEPTTEQPATQPEAEQPVVEAPELEPVTAAGEIPNVEGDTVTTASGLRYIDITVGDGPAPTQGQTCVMHYTGWLTDGTKFDSSRDSGRPFPFVLGAGRVIRGWDEGVATMKVGGRRLLIIPGDLGYGARGYPPKIPSNATLLFDVELLEVR